MPISGRIVAVEIDGVRRDNGNQADVLRMAQNSFELMSNYLGFESSGDLVVKITTRDGTVQDMSWEGINGGWMTAIDDAIYEARRARGITIPSD